MRDDTWARIESRFAEFPRTRAEPVPQSELEAFESELQFRLPADYAEFIRRFGGGYVGPYLIFGLRRCEYAGKAKPGLLTESTSYYRQQQWPGFEENWLPIGEDHSGNPYCVDSAGSIWLADHDVGKAIFVAKDFDDFVRRECLDLSD